MATEPRGREDCSGLEKPRKTSRKKSSSTRGGKTARLVAVGRI